ncbi:MAG TPA: ExeM/NucH family extracellular endonuclease [Candidatus Limnocylindria bacterium]|nr:ExeM/NucH family extracellular endonuclease [Candidatus Limnocylindria bacterium]
MGVSLLVAFMLISGLTTTASPLALAATSVFINEFHYDNTGTDAGEFIEIAGPAGTDLTGWSIVLYNGANGAVYDTDALSGTIPDQQNGFGTVSLSYPVNGIQNGAPDGIALVNGTTVIQFLSYEGTFTAVGGPANGMTSTAIGATEIGTEPIGRSLQLQGSGTSYEDFSWSAPIPSTQSAVNTGQTFAAVIADGAPSIQSTSPTNGATGVARGANITLTFNEPVNVTGAWYSISCVVSGAHSATASGGPSSFTLDPDTDFAANETCTVTVTGAQVSDQDLADPPDTMAGNFSFSFTTIDLTNCGEPATYIHQIQGSGMQSGMIGQTRTVEGVVVGDYQATTEFRGYHLQEEDGDADTDPATSEGIFVFSTTPVDRGDVVRVTGRVSEFSSSGTLLTQLGSVTRTLICPPGGTVTATDVDLPVASISDLERFESMLVSFDQRLTVTETFGLGRFGEVVLSSAGRLATPTAVVEPGAAAQAMQAQNDRSRIVLDDGINDQNVDPTRYPQGGLSASNTLRVGDTIATVTGVLEQRFGLYRIQPVGPLSFDHDNARPAAAPPVGGSARVAAMNVLNYFTTFDPTPRAAGPFICGPTATLECRGANDAFEFERQRAKVIAALAGLDADIVGLMEIENNDNAAIEDLVAGLNAALGAGTYSYIDTGTIGTDAIKVALIYRPAAATPVGAHAILTSAVDPRFIDTLNRPALAQTFDLATGGRFTVVVNHLKSKGSPCPGDPDTGDGSGNCNGTRTLAAQALVDWLATDPTGSGDRDVLVIGDLNAYAKEDPIDVFRNAGYTDLIDAFQDDAYSYVFQGQSGYLDHALASPTLAAQVSGANEWHINADEPTVLDYNTDFKSAGHVESLYAPDAYRSSDHDPVVIGLSLVASETLTPVGEPGTTESQAGSTVVLRYTGTTTYGDAVLEGPTSQRVDCTTGAPSGPAQTETLASNGNEMLRWKTDKAWRGECRQLQLVMESGAVITVRFDFR